MSKLVVAGGLISALKLTPGLAAAAGPAVIISSKPATSGTAVLVDIVGFSLMDLIAYIQHILPAAYAGSKRSSAHLALPR